MGSSTRSARGRPRNAAIDVALHDAVVAMIVESGAAQITVQQLTRRAGVTRDAFYRRYHSVGHLLVSLATTRYRVDPTRDTGTLVGDLRVVIEDQVEMYTDGIAGDLLPLLLDACARDHVVAELFERQFLSVQRASTTRVIERAVERREIPPVDDYGFVLDLVYGPALLRAALPGNAPLDGAFVERMVRVVVGALNAPL